jgi:hypothetical protein
MVSSRESKNQHAEGMATERRHTMSTEERVRLERVGGVGRYANREIFMAEAQRLHSQAFYEVVVFFFTLLGKAFGNPTAPRVKKTRPAPPTAVAARHGAAV